MILMKPIINVDVDGVLYDFTGKMRTDISTVMNIPIEQLGDPDGWNLYKSWGITHDQFYSVMYDGIAHGRVFRTGEVIGYPHEPLSRLKQHGWHVRLVTAKTFRDDFITMQARKNTLTWLYDNEIPHDTIVFSDNLGKVHYTADAVVDDKPATEHWAIWGAYNFLFDRPWNKVAFPPEDVEVTRVRSLQEVADRLVGP